MEKRILKYGIEEMSENLKNRIMKIAQELLQHDKSKEGEFFELEYKGPQFTVDLFNTILSKVTEEFYVDIEEENHTTINNVMTQLQMTEGSQFIKELEEKLTNGEREQVDTKTD
tara:strand:- start:1722 stop:2063 length:342 start_codon:yes stop_codon:yes gene_type:complete